MLKRPTLYLGQGSPTESLKTSSVYIYVSSYIGEKEEIFLSPMTKAPTPTKKKQKASLQHTKRHQKLR